MIFPEWDILRRPGFMIPVFFLSSCVALAQDASFLDARSSALGGCYTCAGDGASAALNQAGLAASISTSLHLNHSRPFISRDLGISTIAVKVRSAKGGLGFCLSHQGISGMQQNSLWIAYGTSLGKSLSGGAGIHLQHTGIRGETFHRMGTGCALGLQCRIGENLDLGCHLSLPLHRTRGSELAADILNLATGLKYTFFDTARLYLQLLGSSTNSLQWGGGLEIILRAETSLMLGLRNKPFCISSGIAISLGRIPVVLSAAWCPDSGFHPSSSLSHEW